MNQRWLCSDVWMDIFPSFDRPQLGLKMALLSDRFDVLVDAHFDDKTTKFTIWRCIAIRKGIGPEPTLSVQIDDKWIGFPLPDRPLPNKIRFKDLQIAYIDDSVITFLRSNKQIWDRKGTNLNFWHSYETEEEEQQMWDVLARQILPIFATNIRHLDLPNVYHLDNFRRRISPTLLTDLDQLNSINSGLLFPDGIADNGPNATAGQALTKWLHTPSKNGQPKRLFCEEFNQEEDLDWINNFKEAFLRATTSVSYKIRLELYDSTPIEPFESVNERTQEKLKFLLVDENGYEFTKKWLLKRCPINEKAAAIQWENDEIWDDNLNTVQFSLWGGKTSIGPYGFLPTKKKKKRVKASKYRRIARKTN